MATTLTESNREYVPSAWEDVACMFCGSPKRSSLEAFGPQNRYHYVRCADCGLAYLNPRPRYDQEFVETAYDVYASSVEDVWKDGKLTAEGQRRYGWYSKLLEEMESVTGSKQSRLLEIGCHTGFFCKVAMESGWNVTGVDISPSTTELARKVYGVNALTGNWLEMELGAPFNLIYCSHTIEHVPNPEEWMACFAKSLAKDGVLCLEVPNMQSMDRKFKRALKRLGLRRGSQWEPWRTPDHLYEPCERSFIPFALKNGWKLLGVSTYSRKNHPSNPLQKLVHEKLRIGSNLRFYLKRA